MYVHTSITRYLIFLRQVLSLYLNLIISARWLAGQPVMGSAHLHLPILCYRPTGMPAFTWGPENWLRSSCFHSQCFCP